MPRVARIVVTGIAHHITQRGNNRQDVFFVDDDRRVYMDLLKKNCEKYEMRVHGYCLMTNHVHLVAIPEKEESLAKAVGRTHFFYSQYINRFHNRSGHLWQGRFYSCALDERHFWLAMRYIEHNPVRAKLCRKPWRYKWSSASAHIDGAAESELLDLSCWYKMISAGRWRRELEEGLNEQQVYQMRVNTHTGRPLGSDGFLSKCEKLIGRRVRPLPIGRPKKKNRAKC